MAYLLDSRANEVARDNLALALATERPLALVGAGISVAAGMPTWSGLLEEMEGELPPLHEEYRTALREEPDLLWRAEEYRKLIGDTSYQSLLQRRFRKSGVLNPTSTAVALVQLPFRHFLTTNYDDVLLDAHAIGNLRAPRVLNWSRDEDVRAFIFSLRDSTAGRYILHLHGHHSDPKTMVLTENDYAERYVRSDGTARKLFAIFTTERVVFSGFSLNDPDLMALMREVNATIRADEPRHFAIVGLEKRVNEILERNRLRRKYGVEPVFYDNRDKLHAGLIETLSFLRERVASPATASPTQAVVPEIPAKASAPITAPAIEVIDVDPEDPQKGKWGGLARMNDRELTATVKQIEPDWFETTMIVRSTNKKRPLNGEVVFHLHPTIPAHVRSVPVNRGLAKLKIESYGAYTVGAVADQGKTQLELDLASLKNAPLMFRIN